MDKEMRFSVTPGSVVLVIAILASAYFAWHLRDLILLVVTAVVLASSIRPGVLFFTRLKLPRFLSVLLMYFLVFSVVFGIVYLFLPPVLSETAIFISSLPHYLDSINLPFSNATASEIISDGDSTLTSLISFQQIFTDTSQGFIRLLALFFGGIFATMLVVVLSFYFSLQETGVEDFLRLVTPLRQEEYVISLWRRTQHKIGLWMQGQLILSLLAGVLVYLGLLIVGAPYALLLAILTALFELIPIFGSLFAGGIAVAVAFTGSGVPLALVVAGLYVVVNQFEANLIYPLVVKKIVGVPPLLVILALIVGAELAGFLGAFLAVPVAALLREFVNDLDQGRRVRAASPSE